MTSMIQPLQIEKIVLFLIERQGLLARDLRHLREQAENDINEENMVLSITRVSENENHIEKYRQVVLLKITSLISSVNFHLCKLVNMAGRLVESFWTFYSMWK
jgi:hypothetical protein